MIFFTTFTLDDANIDSIIEAADLDERIAYPDEKLYAEEYKREAVNLDESIAYPDEKLYAEEY